jgi:hypothetical protein
VARHKFAVTSFLNFAAAGKAEESLTIEILAGRTRKTARARKDQLPWLKLARFRELRTEKNSLRHDANVFEIAGIEADYGCKIMPASEAVEKLTMAGLWTLNCTSPSHTEDAPRWRVIRPTSGPLPPFHWEKLIGRLNGLFSGIFSGGTWTLSQAYYFGSAEHRPQHEVHVIDGSPINELEEFDEVSLGKPGATVKTGAFGERTSGRTDESALLADIISGRNYHVSTARLLGGWARMGVTRMDARRSLLEAYDVVAHAGSDAKWTVRCTDVDRCLNDIYGADEVFKLAPLIESEAREARVTGHDGIATHLQWRAAIHGSGAAARSVLHPRGLDDPAVGARITVHDVRQNASLCQAVVA